MCVDGEPQIVGIVVDRTNEEPLSTALVSVAATEWASLTTESGRFQLCGIRAGKHLITVERLGYQTLYGRVDAAAPAAPVLLNMAPDPILLEGLEIVTDRFERRRRATAYSVRAFAREDIASSPYWTAADFVASRGMVSPTPCDGGDWCVWSRGRSVKPTVYLDEMPLFGGWRELQMVPTSQLHMIEVYRRGTHIRAYTHHFMEPGRTNSPLAIPDLVVARCPARRVTGCLLASAGHTGARLLLPAPSRPLSPLPGSR